MKKLSNEGFTLVELMVVVSIIGILSAVAIPNFKSYQAKSKTSEAKLQLASMYSAETALQSDYDSYATCLQFAGYTPPTRGNYYALGFSAHVATDSAVKVDTGAGGGTNCANDVDSFGVDSKRGSYAGGTFITRDTLSTVIPDSEMTDDIKNMPGTTTPIVGKTGIGVGDEGDWFVIGAAGMINPSATTPITDADLWVIDENKTLLNLRSGVNVN